MTPYLDSLSQLASEQNDLTAAFIELSTHSPSSFPGQAQSKHSSATGGDAQQETQKKSLLEIDTIADYVDEILAMNLLCDSFNLNDTGFVDVSNAFEARLRACEDTGDECTLAERLLSFHQPVVSHEDAGNARATRSRIDRLLKSVAGCDMTGSTNAALARIDTLIQSFMTPSETVHVRATLGGIEMLLETLIWVDETRSIINGTEMLLQGLVYKNNTRLPMILQAFVGYPAMYDIPKATSLTDNARATLGGIEVILGAAELLVAGEHVKISLCDVEEIVQSVFSPNGARMVKLIQSFSRDHENDSTEPAMLGRIYFSLPYINLRDTQRIAGRLWITLRRSSTTLLGAMRRAAHEQQLPASDHLFRRSPNLKTLRMLPHSLIAWKRYFGLLSSPMTVTLHPASYARYEVLVKQLAGVIEGGMKYSLADLEVTLGSLFEQKTVTSSHLGISTVIAN